MKVPHALYASVLLAYLISIEDMGAQQQQDTAPPPSQRFPAAWYPPADPLATIAAPVGGKPFTAAYTYTSRTTKLATGKVSNFETKTLRARDSSGRYREEEEQPYLDRDGKVVKVRSVTVTDPVSHCTFTWSEPWIVPTQGDNQPLAQVTCKPRVTLLANGDTYAELVAEPARTTKQGDVERKVEKLPSSTENGLTLIGNRVLVTHKVDGTLCHVVGITQYSPYLEQAVHNTIEQPDLPDGTAAFLGFDLSDIHLGEPSPDLFYPPHGYRIESVQLVKDPYHS